MKKELSIEEQIAVYYNIACVYSRLSEEEADEKAEGEKLKMAFENLEKTFELGIAHTSHF